MNVKLSFSMISFLAFLALGFVIKGTENTNSYQKHRELFIYLQYICLKAVLGSKIDN